jgi:hypothetical protein
VLIESLTNVKITRIHKEVLTLKKTDIFNNEMGEECIGCSVTNGSLIPIGGIIKETASPLTDCHYRDSTSDSFSYTASK